MTERAFTDTSPQRIAGKWSELRNKGYRLVTKGTGQPSPTEYTKTIASGSEHSFNEPQQTTLTWIE